MALPMSMFFMVLVGLIVAAYADGECGNTPVEKAALGIAPYAQVAQDHSAPVSEGCCDSIKKLSTKKECLCAAMLSKVAQQAGIKPEIVVTIPKRCNFQNRPVGYRCGAYTLPYTLPCTWMLCRE